MRNKEISNIDISVTDENNRFISFNNVEYSIILAITTTRILKERINSLFRGSTQQIMDKTQPQNVETNTGGDENDLDCFMYKHGIQI